MFTFNEKLVIPTDRRFLSKECANPILLNIVGLPESEWGSFVRVFDKNGPLVLLHYLTMYNSEEDLTVNLALMAHIGHVRGVVINTMTNKIVCKSYDYTPDMIVSDDEKMASLSECDYSKLVFYSACEGTVVRLFWHNEWLISTHRKINAHNSYWNGPTFGTLFNELSKNQFEDLDQNLCYVFLLSHDANRLIYKITSPQLMLLTIYDCENNEFVEDYSTVKNPTFCCYPQKILVHNKEELVQLVNNMHMSKTFDNSGIIAIGDLTNQKPIKFISQPYNLLKNVRGNVPNMRSRYLQLRNTENSTVFVNWYSDKEYQEIFFNVEQEVKKLATKLQSMYVNRYIKKDFSELPKEDFIVLKRCHASFLETRIPVNTAKVLEMINTTPNHFVQVMLNKNKALKATQMDCE